MLQVSWWRGYMMKPRCLAGFFHATTSPAYWSPFTQPHTSSSAQGHTVWTDAPAVAVLRYMLLASVKSEFPKDIDVGSIIWLHDVAVKKFRALRTCDATKLFVADLRCKNFVKKWLRKSLNMSIAKLLRSLPLKKWRHHSRVESGSWLTNTSKKFYQDNTRMSARGNWRYPCRVETMS